MNTTYDTKRTATAEETARVLRGGDQLRERSRRGPLARLAGDVFLLFEMVRDFWNGAYTRVPKEVVLWGVAVLAYILSPVDLVPDFLPGVGLLDDAAVFMVFMNSVGNWLDDYRAWRGERAPVRLAGGHN